MLKKRRFFWQTVPLQILLVLALLLFASIDGSRRFHRLALEHLTGVLEDNARLASNLTAEAAAAGDVKSVDALCKAFGRSMSRRVTVIRADGTILGDSEKDPASMQNHSDRPEVREALSGRHGIQQRYSMTLDRRMMYVAVPLNSGGRVVGAVRVSESLDDVAAFVRTARFRMGLLPWLAGFMVVFLGLLYARRLRRSVGRIREALIHIEKGDYSHRVDDVPVPVLDPVVYGLNHADESLKKRTASADREREKLEAVLSAMAEGVILIDGKDCIQKMNPSAERTLGLKFESLRGRPCYEVIRSGELLRFIEKIQKSREPLEENILLRDAGDQCLRVRGSQLARSDCGIQDILILLGGGTRPQPQENQAP